LKAVGIDKDGNEVPLQFVIEEFLSTQLRPLLNYVFFTENSKDMRPEYTSLTPEEANSFYVDKLFNYETLQLYHQMMNIVGRRLQEHPDAKITLVGCNADTRDEKGNTELSRQRAETVRDYFKSVWHLDDSRISIQVRNLPEKASGETTEDGIAENRRVEILCDDWHVLEPVLTVDTLRVPRPPIVRFKPVVKADAGVANWKVTGADQSRILKTYDGTTTVPEHIDWHIEKEKQQTLANLKVFKYQLSASDQAGQHVSTPLDTIPVTQLTLAKKRELHIADTVFSTYNLILFDFGKATLSAANQRIADFVKEKILPNDIITIKGYADRIGTLEYNRNLAGQRAKATSLAVGTTTATVVGVGNTELLYDNDPPEGRFYCRTVTIFVASPQQR
ncbi:MAG TPA: OmpA family protein, partial [Candidatus Kapabacteria bacterium]|nr:OmpA family protein [Candidatus Kapabacteria bacterium]